MVKGIDTAARLSAKQAAAIRALGYGFVGRYLVPETGTLAAKALTKAEAEAITGAGLRLLTVWETTADRARGGAYAGVADGKKAKACAEAIGMPAGGVIYFAVDYDAQDGEMDTIAAYLIAAAGMCRPYRVGVYGSYRVVEAMRAREVCEHFWQCVAWSAGKRSPALTVYQSQWSGGKEARAAAAKIGVAVDINECPDVVRAGIWTYEEDEDLNIDKLTDEECWAIVEKAQRHAAALAAPDWARDELKEAVAAGITDGTRPMQLIPRYQAAIMAKRAAAK